MIAIGVFLAWAAYGLGIWGVSLIKGYNLGFSDIWSPVAYYNGKWPPAQAGNTVIIPDGKADSIVTAAFQSSTPATSTSSGGGAGSDGGVAGAATSAISGALGVPGEPSGLSNSAAIQKAAAQFGWGSGTQWGCIQWLVSAESGGNPLIANPSGAFGIAQALGHGTGCSAASGVTYTVSGGVGRRTSSVNAYGPQYGLSCAQAQQANQGNAWYQALWMMGYIKARYHTPCAAKAFHEANGYY